MCYSVPFRSIGEQADVRPSWTPAPLSCPAARPSPSTLDSGVRKGQYFTPVGRILPWTRRGRRDGSACSWVHWMVAETGGPPTGCSAAVWSSNKPSCRQGAYSSSPRSIYCGPLSACALRLNALGSAAHHRFFAAPHSPPDIMDDPNRRRAVADGAAADAWTPTRRYGCPLSTIS